MLAPIQVQFANFEPDKGPYTQGVSDAICNAHPTADGYKPLAGWNGVGTALASRPYGAITARKASGTTDIYAFTLTKAYKQDGTDVTWDEVTRGIGTAVDNYASTGLWSLCQYGTYLIACNGVEETQYIDVDSGTEFDDLANAPNAAYCTVMGERLLLGKLSTDPRAVAWSGPNNATYWTYGFRGSDTKTFLDGGTVQGVLGINTDALVFQDDKIRILRYVGGNVVYQPSTLHENLGCFAPASIVAARGVPYWYAESGFFAGMEARPIGAERVNEWIFRIVTPENRALIQGTVDPTENIVWWRIPLANSTSFMLGYDYVLDKWLRSETDTTYIFPAISPGYTIDDLGTLGYTMDTIPYPFDSPFWAGSGVQSLAAFGPTHLFGYFSGENQEACLESNDFEFNTGAHAFVQSCRVVGDANRAIESVQIGTRRWHGEDIAWGSEITPSSTTGVAYLRKRAKLHRIRVNIGTGDWEVANGITVYAKQAGSR